MEYQAELLARFTADVLPKILGECPSGKKLQIVVHRAFRWEDVVEATKEMEQARNTGKLVCTID